MGFQIIDRKSEETNFRRELELSVARAELQLRVAEDADAIAVAQDELNRLSKRLENLDHPDPDARRAEIERAIAPAPQRKSAWNLLGR